MRLRSDRLLSPADAGVAVALALLTIVVVRPSGAADGSPLELLLADHPVTDTRPELALVEPHLAVDPDDPDHLVAGTIVVSPAEGRPVWTCAALASFDGGRTWTRHDFDVDRCIDPWVVFTHDAVLLATLEIGRNADGADGEGTRPPFRTLLWRSVDGGRSWSTGPLDLGEAHEHPMLVAGAEEGGVWLASRRMRGSLEQPRHTLGIQRSADAGRSFTELVELEPSALGLTPTGVAALPSGDLAVSWIDFRHDVDGERVGRLERARAWLTTVDLRGRATPPHLVTEACGPTDGFAGYPFLAAGPSDADGVSQLHHLCVRSGFDGLALTVGAVGHDRIRWGETRRVDPVPVGRTAHARTPMVAVNRDGDATVAWYGRRADPELRCQELLVVAAEREDGPERAEPTAVSSRASCPDVDSNRRVARSWPMGGDYSSLASAPDGSFHLLWADARSGLFRLRHARLRLSD